MTRRLKIAFVFWKLNEPWFREIRVALDAPPQPDEEITDEYGYKWRIQAVLKDEWGWGVDYLCFVRLLNRDESFTPEAHGWTPRQATPAQP